MFGYIKKNLILYNIHLLYDRDKNTFNVFKNKTYIGILEH